MDLSKPKNRNEDLASEDWFRAMPSRTESFKENFNMKRVGESRVMGVTEWWESPSHPQSKTREQGVNDILSPTLLPGVSPNRSRQAAATFMRYGHILFLRFADVIFRQHKLGGR